MWSPKGATQPALKSTHTPPTVTLTSTLVSAVEKIAKKRKGKTLAVPVSPVRSTTVPLAALNFATNYTVKPKVLESVPKPLYLEETADAAEG